MKCRAERSCVLPQPRHCRQLRTPTLRAGLSDAAGAAHRRLQRRRHRRHRGEDHRAVGHRAARSAGRGREQAGRHHQHRHPGGDHAQRRTAIRCSTSPPPTRPMRRFMPACRSISCATSRRWPGSSSSRWCCWSMRRCRCTRSASSSPMRRPIPARSAWPRSAIGTTSHLSGELLKLTHRDRHRPRALSRRRADDHRPRQRPSAGGFDALPGSLPHVRTGALRPLAVTAAARSESLPDIPTIGDTIPGYEASSWAGIGVPRGTPPEVIETHAPRGRSRAGDPADPGAPQRSRQCAMAARTRRPSAPISRPKPRNGRRSSSSPASRRSSFTLSRRVKADAPRRSSRRASSPRGDRRSNAAASRPFPRFHKSASRMPTHSGAPSVPSSAAIKSPLAPPMSQPPSATTWKRSVQGACLPCVYIAVIRVGV